MASFVFSDESLTRQYDIKVTQYDCGSEVGGPPDCLQYHMGTSGSTASFNFPTGSSAVTASSKLTVLVGFVFLFPFFSATHLANQHYDICFRRESGMCAICYIPAIAIGTVAGNTVNTQSSFGLA